MLKTFGLLFCAACLILVGAAPANAGEIFADWTSTTAGTLGGTSFSVSSIVPVSVASINLSNSNYSPTSGGPVDVLVFEAASNWSVSFGSPLDVLDLYVVSWWPSDAYTFDQSFTVHSGLAGVGISGNSLTVTTRNSGILRFTNISSLSLTGSTASNSNGITFAMPDVQTPEPATAGMLAFSLAAFGLAYLRRR